MLRRGVHSPVCTSMGRLFDGFSAMLGFSYENTHQAQSPQLLEYAAWAHGRRAEPLPLPWADPSDLLPALDGRFAEAGRLRRLDWRVMVRTLLSRWRRGESPESLAAAFHHGLVDGAIRIARMRGLPRVVLSGGVFCNRYLSEALLERLAGAGVAGHAHAQLPPTDGCLAAGQLWVAAHRR